MMTVYEKQLELRVAMLERFKMDVMKRLGMGQDEIDAYERAEAMDRLVETGDTSLLCEHLVKINGRNASYK